MTQRIFVFKTKPLHKDAQPQLMAIPQNQIAMVRSFQSGDTTYLEVNNIVVNGSFDTVIKLLGERINII
jgi:hypothetical protein